MPTCIEWFSWLASGVVLVPLLAWLKTVPKIGAVIEQYAWLIAPLLAALLPQIAHALQSYCAVVDPLAWAVIYTALVYFASQIVYWVAKKAGAKV